jgi:hypothetical protein
MSRTLWPITSRAATCLSFRRQALDSNALAFSLAEGTEEWRRLVKCGEVDELLGYAPISAAARSRQNCISISWYIVVAVLRCSCASCRFPMHR